MLSFEDSDDESDSDGCAITKVKKDVTITKVKKMSDVTKSRFQSEKQAAKRMRISIDVDSASISTSATFSKMSSSSLPLKVCIGSAQDIGKRGTQEDRFL